MDLSGKNFSPSQSYLQSAGSLVSAYGLGSSLVGNQAITNSLYSATSQSLTSPIHSGNFTTSQSPLHSSHSNGHSISGNSPSPSDSKKSYSSSNTPVFNRANDAFPYGISGVPMPNYGYHGDVYQFTSNGYPRKSRTCSYCGKVFTRSTTRRYHEKRCPLLRAAVSSYMGDENSGQPQATRVRAGEVTPHMGYKPSGHAALGQYASGISRSKDPQELATSHYAAVSPSMGEKHREMSDPLSGYHPHTSVIVKQEPHELEAASSDQQNFAQEQSESVLGFSPASDSSPQKLENNFILSPTLPTGLDLSSKSPSHTSSGQRDENTSMLNEDYVREQLKSQSDSELDLNQSHLSAFNSQAIGGLLQRSQSIDLTNENLSGDLQGGLVNGDQGGPPSDDLEADGDPQVLKEHSDYMNNADADIVETVPGKKILGNLKCGICMKSFESSGKLHLHEQLHTKFKPYACKFCGLRFSKASMRIAHEKSHNGSDTTHICAVCGSSFTRKYSLKLHMRRWHQEGPWLCRHCGKASLTQTELKNHLYSHNLPRYERESLLYMPDLSSNTGDGMAPSINGAIYTEAGEALGTGEADMTGASQEMEMCHECGRDFPKGYMRQHLKSHEAQKPYSCPICGKRFGYKNNMKSHIKLHTGIKPFQCKMCGAKFTRGSTLRRHARRHGIIADSVWDLFIKPDYSSSRGKQQQQSQAVGVASGAADNHISTPTSQDTITARPSAQTGGVACSTMEEAANYLDGSSISPPSSQGMYPIYPGLGPLQPPTIYSPLPTTTSLFTTQHLPQAVGYAASSSQHPTQADALNLSVQRPADQQSDQSTFSNISGERSRSRSRSLSGSESRRSQYVPAKPGHQDAVVQVNTCCRQPAADVNTSQSGNPSSPLAMVPYIVTSPQQPSSLDATSPASATSGKGDYSTETVSTLIGSGRMFKCYHCECYFSEYAMYRIHAKLHSRDFTRPFVCLVCGEDCHDRVYFALHTSEHLH